MKLVQWVPKDDYTKEELELGYLTEKECDLIDKILNWMDSEKVGILGRYNDVILCEGYEIINNPEDESETMLKFYGE